MISDTPEPLLNVLDVIVRDMEDLTARLTALEDRVDWLGMVELSRQANERGK